MISALDLDLFFILSVYSCRWSRDMQHDNSRWGHCLPRLSIIGWSGSGKGSNLFNFHAIFHENVVKWLLDSPTFGVGDSSFPIWEILDPLMSNSYHADSTTTYFEANSRDCFHWRKRNIYLSLPPSLYPHKHAFSLYNSTDVLQIILIVMCFLITVHFRPMC